MQLIRRIPKRGFNALFKDGTQIVNVEALNRFADNTVVGPAEMKKAGLIGSEQFPVKILGKGKLTKALIIKAHKCSGSAKKLVEAAGAKIEYLK
jgi:large subunit ribosomal protein L15